MISFRTWWARLLDRLTANAEVQLFGRPARSHGLKVNENGGDGEPSVLLVSLLQ
jgi:hypothetical protein